MPVCDGCGAQVDDAHIRQRIERLELATRFRPVHISVLLIDAAPPARPEDYFYRAAASSSDRSSAGREYFDALMNSAGVDAHAQPNDETALAEFQRRGFFLIGAVECALANPLDAQKAIEHAAPTLLRRVKISYKPKSIAMLSVATQPLVAAFQQSDWAPRLILHDGKPFDHPVRKELLAKALAPKAHA
ncbi:MAG TPA: hypothetical protein VN885_09675 [Candidatus Acidoferrales bacterium]|nr:hypothetical protein [Candidatus Acidoferrales bacterium]